VSTNFSLRSFKASSCHVIFNVPRGKELRTRFVITLTDITSLQDVLNKSNSRYADLENMPNTRFGSGRDAFCYRRCSVHVGALKVGAKDTCSCQTLRLIPTCKYTGKLFKQACIPLPESRRGSLPYSTFKAFADLSCIMYAADIACIVCFNSNCKLRQLVYVTCSPMSASGTLALPPSNDLQCVFS
jgi:hypothetical protein